MKQKSILITGATGFLGSYVARELFDAGFHLKLLVRKTTTSAKERLYEIFPATRILSYGLKALLKRIEIIEGDSSRNYLGLSAREYFKLADTVDEVFHCAETTKLRKGEGDTLARINVLGTALISLFCITKRPKRLHYISTAYVAGNRRGTVLEGELERGQSFNNGYERSKYEAERYLAVFLGQYRIPCTIYRPSIITGDTITGYTRNCDNIYVFFRELNRLKARGMPRNGNSFMTPLRIPGDKYSTINLLPVDYAARAIAAISMQAESINKTFHIVNPSPPTLGELAVWLVAATGNNRIKIAPLHEFKMQPHTPEEQLFLRRTAIFQPYMFGEACFDSTNTRSLLSGTGIECPIVTDDLICKYNEYAVGMNWGRKGQITEKMENVDNGFEYFLNHLNTIII
ncbi:MAG: SDR family oxidoreductase [Candidatus Brocadiales bacterium]|nr:SDR family oxidoreductase [Candidatus Brocadiales bacterium]